MLRLLVSLCLAFACASAHAATYYVAKTGSDGNVGSLASPWLTVQKAANTMVAGDTVNIAAGTYAEQVTSAHDGTSGSPIRYVGASAATVTIYGFFFTGDYNLVTTVNLTGTGVASNEACFMTDSGANGCSLTYSSITGSGVYSPSSGASGIYTGTSVPGTNGVYDHLTINNPDHNAVVFVGSGHILTNSTITGSNGWDCIYIIGDNCIIRDNTITNWSNPHANPNHVDLFQTFGNDPAQTCRNVLIERNTVLNAPDCQFGNITDDQENGNISYWTFRNNLFCNIQRVMNLTAPHFTFQNNTFYRVGWESQVPVILINNIFGSANFVTFQNNLYVDCAIPSATGNGWPGGDAVTSPVMDYDLVVGTGAGTVKDSSLWHGGYGGVTGVFETHGINGLDPLFTNVAGGNFTLQSGSPARGAALDLSAQFTTDITGATRTAPWDMGAYKYTGAASLPLPNPSTIASTSPTATSMTVVASTTTGGTGAIQYNHAINGTYQGLQASPSRTFTGLTPSTSYAFKVKAQDSATPTPNATTESAVSNVSTTGTIPTVSTVTVPSAGTTVVVGLSASCTTGTGGSGGFTATVTTGAALTFSGVAGSGSSTYTLTPSRNILATDVFKINYLQPGNGIEATVGGADLASFTLRAVTNNSTQVAPTAPTVSSVTIPAAGTTSVITWNQSASSGAGGTGGFTATASGGPLTVTYSTGLPGLTTTLTNSRTVAAGETVVIHFVQPGNGFEGTVGAIDVASFSNQPVFNSSTANIPTTTPTPPGPERVPKPKKKR